MCSLAIQETALYPDPRKTFHCNARIRCAKPICSSHELRNELVAELVPDDEERKACRSGDGPRRNVFCSDHVFSNAHPSSREPGNLADLERRRTEILDALPAAEREAYLAAHHAKMSGKPRIHIVP